MKANQLFSIVLKNKNNLVNLAKKFIPNINTTLIKNLSQMATSNDCEGLKIFARNFMKSKGRDFDKEFAEFMKHKDE